MLHLFRHVTVLSAGRGFVNVIHDGTLTPVKIGVPAVLWPIDTVVHPGTRCAILTMYVCLASSLFPNCDESKLPESLYWCDCYVKNVRLAASGICQYWQMLLSPLL